MTDERLGDGLLDAVARLPRGRGHRLPPLQPCRTRAPRPVRPGAGGAWRACCSSPARPSRPGLGRRRQPRPRARRGAAQRAGPRSAPRSAPPSAPAPPSSSSRRSSPPAAIPDAAPLGPGALRLAGAAHAAAGDRAGRHERGARQQARLVRRLWLGGDRRLASLTLRSGRRCRHRRPGCRGGRRASGSSRSREMR